MKEKWSDLLPEEYRNRVIQPLFFESHMDPLANAVKYIGFDKHARRCFYSQSFLVTEEGFDVDEFPILIDIYFERVVAWKLVQSGWIKIKSFTDELDRCHKHVKTLPVEMTNDMPR